MNYLRYSHIVLVSGGVGVTPATAMVREIYRVSGDYSDADPLPPHAIRSVHFVWVIKDLSTADIFLPMLNDAYAMSKKGNKPALFITICVSKKKDGSEVKSSSPFIKSGRPVWPTILGEVTTKTKPGIMFACGPASLVSDASNIIFEHSNVNNQRWDFHHEVFDF